MVRLLKLFPNLASPTSSSSGGGPSYYSPTSSPEESPVIPGYNTRPRARRRGSSGAHSSNFATLNVVNALKPCYWSPTLERWKHVPDRSRKHDNLPEKVTVVTWNVDFMASWVDERMNAVLEHLKDEILVSDEEKESDDDDDESSSDEEDGSDGESRRQRVEASVVLLQEVHVQALDTIKENKWVQDNFIILPREATKWPPGAKYGNVTLVSRDLEVAKCSIVKFGSSMMHRAAVFVDIWMAGGAAASEEDYVLRIANVHLESMKEGTQQRPRQLEVVSQFMNEETGELSGGIIAGDMNPIEPSVDLGLPESFGFLDAWTGGERNEEGWTWGYQGGTEGGRYPQARFDKVLYLRRREYEVDEPRRVGVGLRAQNYNGDTFWASDHFGLKTTVWSM